MKLKINNVLYEMQVAPVLVETLNETFDTFSCVLPFTSVATPFAPQSEVLLLDDENKAIQKFVIVSDKVELSSHEKQIYKHSLELTEFIQTLNKRYIKDMSFRQPPSPIKRDYSGVGIFYNEQTSSFEKLTTSYTSRDYCEIKLSKNEKIRRCYIRTKAVSAGNNLAYTKNDEIYSGNYSLDANYKLEISNVPSANVLPKTKTIQITQAGTYEFKDDDFFNYYTSTERKIVLEFPNGEEKDEDFNVGESSLTPYADIYYELVVETYYFSLWDVLEDIRIADNIIYKFNNENETNYLFSNGIKMPYSMGYTLKNTVAPDIVIQQSTTYQAINEVAKFLDGVWKVNPTTNELEIEYFNDNTANKIETNIADTSLELVDENYVDNLICYFQNGKANINNVKWTPSKTQFKVLTGKTIGAFNESEMYFHLDSQIEDIVKVEVLIPSASISIWVNGTTRAIFLTNYYLDITPFVVSEDESALLDYISSKPVIELNYATTYNSVSFQRGATEIPMASKTSSIWGLQYLPLKYAIRSAIAKKFALSLGTGAATSSLNVSNFDEEHFSSLEVRVAYTTPINGKIKLESKEKKFDGEVLTNQSSGEPSIESLSNNMFGLSLKLGQPKRNVIEKFNQFTNRPKKGEIRVIDGDIWRADTIKTTIYNTFVQCETTYVKNFNQLSSRIEINSTKRFYEIDKAITSEENICEHIIFTTNVESRTNPSLLKVPSSLTHNNINYGTCCITDDFMEVFAKNFNNSRIEDDYLRVCGAVINNNMKTQKIYIPFVSYGGANFINFKMNYQHSILAGYERKENPLRNSVVNYTTTNGFLEKMDILLYTANNDTNPFTSPLIDNNTFTNLNKKLFVVIPDYLAHKKPTEIMGVDFQVSLLPEKKDVNNIFFGSALTINNILLTGESQELQVYYSDSKYSNYDKYAKGIKLENCNIVCGKVKRGLSGISGYYELEIANLTQEHTSWCICNEKKEILIAINSNNNKIRYYVSGKDRE